MILKLKRTPGIYIVGFMGSGKTTIGRLLAARIGWKFYDIDDDIETRHRISIAEIFATRGESEFRRLESEAIRARVRRVECGVPAVLALGGGAFVQPDIYAMLGDNGVTIWLDCPFDLIRQRVSGDGPRPLARDPVAFEQLYIERRKHYALADFRVETSAEDPIVTVESVLNLPLFQ